MIEFKNVTKSYKGGKNVLNGLNLTINDGEFIFIVGDTGAGKTTMTRLLLREEKADSGSIIVNGVDLTRMPNYRIPKYRRRLGVVFQDFRLFPGMKVHENLEFVMRVTGTPRSSMAKRTAHILHSVYLDNKKDSYPYELSGGEQQRVALARAIINNPQIIIADEPTGNVDPGMSREIMDLLVSFNSLNRIVIVVTHELELVKHYGKRVVKIENGMITELTGGAV